MHIQLICVVEDLADGYRDKALKLASESKRLLLRNLQLEWTEYASHNCVRWLNKISIGRTT